VRKFLEVSFRGWKEAIANPESAAKLVIAKYYPEGALDYQTESLKQIGTLMTRENPQIGQMRRETWVAAADMFKRYEIGKVPESIDDLVDFQFLKAIYPISNFPK
jgi:ABC-type nitrate/sulfonate/bicarbonate transport system substrate-binding protein